MDENFRYVTLAEVRELLEKEMKLREFSTEQKLAVQHAQQHARINSQEAKSLVKELEKMDKITSALACKIADLLPTHPDDVRALFTKQRTTLDEKEIDAILNTVKKYLPTS